MENPPKIEVMSSPDENQNQFPSSPTSPTSSSPFLPTPPTEYIQIPPSDSGKYFIFFNERIDKVFRQELQKSSTQLDSTTTVSSSSIQDIHCFAPSESDMELKSMLNSKPPVTSRSRLGLGMLLRRPRAERGSSVPAIDSYYGTQDMERVGHASYFIPELSEEERKVIGWMDKYDLKQEGTPRRSFFKTSFGKNRKSKSKSYSKKKTLQGRQATGDVPDLYASSDVSVTPIDEETIKDDNPVKQRSKSKRYGKWIKKFLTPSCLKKLNNVPEVNNNEGGRDESTSHPLEDLHDCPQEGSSIIRTEFLLGTNNSFKTQSSLVSSNELHLHNDDDEADIRSILSSIINNITTTGVGDLDPSSSSDATKNIDNSDEGQDENLNLLGQQASGDDDEGDNPAEETYSMSSISLSPSLWGDSDDDDGGYDARTETPTPPPEPRFLNYTEDLDLKYEDEEGDGQVGQHLNNNDDDDDDISITSDSDSSNDQM